MSPGPQNIDLADARRNESGCQLRPLAPLGKSANDLRLAIAANIAVAGERRHDVIMPEVL